ncbi:hypothetical protein EG349_04195 [Chryseobacterium shandongense]|uniref:Uncharacterized protein n=1 Tax=Chryseobacterium shandongense TaxID=1493872 RepID=A0AAD0YCZ7_9FLAO|nr:hypothetical protein [Chryseobacterium shandongense]AZA86038.1 hypothetical protein EG349_04195 [Chryseobacterium shandongense]AZA94446.1 hypothetical protein EG353_02215 [Chryseobacterium shandongense]
MYIRYFFIVVCLLAMTSVSAQHDGTTLNVRLYPVQMLAISPAVLNSDDTKASKESSFVVISSPSGFEIMLQQNVYNNSAGFKNSDSGKLLGEKDKAYNLINYEKGVVEKIFEINHHAKEEKKYTSDSDNNYYILTMMSN